MIVSHEHKFIFLKTYKTASTSMELALNDVCGPDDIITPSNEQLSAGRKIKSQNFRIDHPEKPKIKWWRRLLGRPERYYHPTVGYYEHMFGSQVRTYLGDELWNRYYKFCFERNPWDRQLSFYYYKTRSGDRRQKQSFQRFMRTRKRAYVPNYDIYSIDGEIAVDRVGRYENINEDFEEILSEIGLKGQVELPRANVSKKDHKVSYREAYTPELRDLVANWYEREITHFGYEF